MLCYIILYYTILYYNMLYHILLSFIMLYYICARVHVTVAMHASICAMAKAW